MYYLYLAISFFSTKLVSSLLHCKNKREPDCQILTSEWKFETRCKMANHLWVPVRCPLAWVMRLGTDMIMLTCPCIIVGFILFDCIMVCPMSSFTICESKLFVTRYCSYYLCAYIPKTWYILNRFLIPFCGIVSQSAYFNHYQYLTCSFYPCNN